jgi:hypothetical protein
MSPSKSPSLQSALAQKKDADFIRTLQLVDTNQAGTHFVDRPHPLAMIWGLVAFHQDVALRGIRGFLDPEEGNGFRETEEWCGTVGAKRAKAYLAATAKLFPNGRVPKDDLRRFEITSKLEQMSPVDPPDPFVKLDRKYVGAMDELASALRRYVAKHREEIESAIERGFSPSPLTKAEIQASEREFDRVMKKVDRSIKVQEREEKKRAAAAKKALASTPKTADPAMVTFIDAIIALSREEWMAVYRQYARLSKGARDSARLELATVLVDGNAGQLHRPERFKARVKASQAQRDRTSAALKALPSNATVDGKLVPLREAAALATQTAWEAVQLHEWLVGYENTEKAARTAYAPFKGLAPTPSIPRRSAGK